MDRSDQVLKEASFHLQYEIGMLIEVAHKLNDKKDIVVYNALLESFMIHTRNLVYFFFGDSTYDDIVAGHFIFGWELVRGPKSLLLRKVEEEANKKVAHLTYQRFIDDTPWDVDQIAAELRGVIRNFSERVDRAKVADDFITYVTSLLNTL